jgi:hypothetical protein
MLWEGWKKYGEKIAWNLSLRDGYQREETLYICTILQVHSFQYRTQRDVCPKGLIVCVSITLGMKHGLKVKVSTRSIRRKHLIYVLFPVTRRNSLYIIIILQENIIIPTVKQQILLIQ